MLRILVFISRAFGGLLAALMCVCVKERISGKINGGPRVEKGRQVTRQLQWSRQ